MLFRIEDSINRNGQHREYHIHNARLPIFNKEELDIYIAQEIRKEINNSKDRRLLSYSKSLGVCLLKYNKFTDNEIHMNFLDTPGYIMYQNRDDDSDDGVMMESYDLEMIQHGIKLSSKSSFIKLINFCIDVSNNSLVEDYLENTIGVSRKRVASPEKDKEVLLFQSPDDIIFTQYTDSIYLLYALAMRFGIDKSIRDRIIEEIDTLDDFRFDCCYTNEREGIIRLVEYLYENYQIERKMSYQIIEDSYHSDIIPVYYDPITQFHDIQVQDFDETYYLGDYNGNVVSDIILDCYAEKYL